MAKLSVKPGSESVSVLLWIADSASTTGAGKTGLVYNSAGLTAYYARPGATPASISLVTQTVTGAWTSGGFVEIDSTNTPGLYRLDVPNAVFAAGVRSAAVILQGASGMALLPLEFDLNAESNLVAILGTVITETVGGYLSAGFKKLFDVASPVFTLASIIQTGDSFARLGAPNGASVSADVASIKVDTGTTILNRLPTTLTAGGHIKADALAISGDTAAADNAEAFFDGTGYVGNNNIIGFVGSVTGNVEGSVANVIGNVGGNVEGSIRGNVEGSVLGNVDGSVTNVTGNVGGNVEGYVASIGTGGISADTFASSGLNAIADAILKRDWTGLTGEAARSLLNAGRFIRNRWIVSGDTLTVMKEDDTTPAWTATLTSDAAADPVTGSDPA